jgi:protein-tyrosine phosphatase
MHWWPFSKKGSSKPLVVDFHSHILPGIDDGARDISESMQLLKALVSSGFQKVITTPHIYPEVYPNSEGEILRLYERVSEQVKKEAIPVEFEVAAEYFMHQELLEKVKSGHQLLTFSSQKYLLIETSFHQQPFIWDQLVFELQVQGYKPVIAHPERYTYVSENPGIVEEWRNQGIKVQVNIPSLVGNYGKAVQKTAREIVNKGAVDFLCTDLHRADQLAVYNSLSGNKLYRQATLLARNSELL